MQLFARRLNTLNPVSRLLPASTAQVIESLCFFSTKTENGNNSSAPGISMIVGNSASVRSLLSAPLSTGLSSASPSLSFSRSHYTGNFMTRHHVQTLNNATDILQLEDVMRLEGSKLDHFVIAAFVRRICRLLQEHADSQGLPPSPAGLLARFEEPERSRYEALVSQVCDVATNRIKWFDPTSAVTVMSCVARWLGRADQAPLVEALTRRLIQRLTEAKTKDVQLALDVVLESSVSAELNHLREPMLRAASSFLQAKLPTGRVPPETVAKTLRILVDHSPPAELVSLFAAVTRDIAVRLEIYSPAALAATLLSLSKAPGIAGADFKLPRQNFIPEGVHVSPDVPLDIAEPLADACLVHFARHAEEYANERDLIKFLGAISKLASPPNEVTFAAPEQGVSSWAKRPTNAAALKLFWAALESRIAASQRASSSSSSYSSKVDWSGDHFPLIIKLVASAARLHCTPPPAVAKLIASASSQMAGRGGMSEFGAAKLQESLSTMGLPVPKEVLDLLRKTPAAAAAAAAPASSSSADTKSA